MSEATRSWYEAAIWRMLFGVYEGLVVPPEHADEVAEMIRQIEVE